MHDQRYYKRCRRRYYETHLWYQESKMAGGEGGRTSKIRASTQVARPSIPSDEWVVSGLKRSKRTPSLTDGARLKKAGVGARQGR